MQLLNVKLILVTCGLFALSGCVENALDRDPDNPAYGQALYEKNCKVCHGADGSGNGPAADGLSIAPANLRLLSARNGGVFDRDAVMSAIFASPSGEGAVMPAFSHGNLGPIILVEENGLATPTPTDLLALATYLASIQDDPG